MCAEVVEGSGGEVSFVEGFEDCLSYVSGFELSLFFIGKIDSLVLYSEEERKDSGHWIVPCWIVFRPCLCFLRTEELRRVMYEITFGTVAWMDHVG